MSFANFISGLGYALKPFETVFDAGVSYETQANTAITQSANLGTAKRRKELADAHAGFFQNQLNNYVDAMRAAAEPWFKYRLDELGLPYVSFAQARDEIVRDFIAQDYYVDGRAVTYGANPADNVVGVHRRLTVNVHGQKIETGYHNISAGITITVTDTEASGESLGITTVSYAGGPDDDQNNFNAKGGGFSVTGVQLVGPEAGNAINTNPTLGGLATYSDGDDIGATDVDNWTQDRSGIGSVTVKVRTSIKWRSQDYGVAFGGTSGNVVFTQSCEDWDLERGVPVAYMIPAYQSGAGVVFDLDTTLGSQSDAFDETDTTNATWVPLVCTLDENLFPENFDETDTDCTFTVTMDAGSSGEIVLGGIYHAKMFQLQDGGEWHVAWEREDQPNLQAQVSFSADSQTAAGEEQDLWSRMDEAGPSLPVSGTSKWSLP